MNLARDPRWGRIEETPGEDPTLNGEYAYAFTKGFQEGDAVRRPILPRFLPMSRQRCPALTKIWRMDLSALIALSQVRGGSYLKASVTVKHLSLIHI